MKPVIALACSLTLPCAMPSCSRQPDIPISFSGSSEKLQATEILATLDAPIPAGKSAIYCASLQAAWKALQDMAGEPVSLQGSPDLAGQLNVAADPRPYIPSDSLYAAAGWVKEGICDRVRQDLRRKFPGSAPPTFEGISPDSCLMYAYLEASLRFSVPYCENTRPLVFTDGAGNQTEVRSFGASPEDEAAYRKLVAQPSVLFRKGEAQAKDEEFAIDLG